jgi:hypothetical protein
MTMGAETADLDRRRLQAMPAARAIGIFTAADFPRARTLLDDLSAFADYLDWLDAREGLRMALFMSGVDVPMLSVDLCLFVRWCELSRAPRDVRSLDEFAALTVDHRCGRLPRALAAIDEFDFAHYNCRIDALTDFDDYSTWMIHRSRVRANAAAATDRVHELRIPLSKFVDWCACLALRESEPALDRYAQLALEEFISELAA